jgi:chorismate mutase / prephenate dehydratase
MDQPRSPLLTLDDARREIDEIDLRILSLLEQRFNASRLIRQIKAQGPDNATGSPVRPARESAILRRLLERASGSVPPAVVVQIWRRIISASTLLQAPAVVRCPEPLFADPEMRWQIRDHFGTIPVASVPDEEAALKAVRERMAEVAVVPLSGYWVQPFLEKAGGDASVIGVLPLLSDGGHPDAVVIGHALAERTGADETLVVTSGRLPRDFVPAPLWDVQTEDGHRLTSLPGFLSESEHPLIGLRRSNDLLALTVVGRYPSPLEVRSP